MRGGMIAAIFDLTFSTYVLLCRDLGDYQNHLAIGLMLLPQFEKSRIRGTVRCHEKPGHARGAVIVDLERLFAVGDIRIPAHDLDDRPGTVSFAPGSCHL